MSAPMPENDYRLHPIGVVRSPLKSREGAPRQGYKGAPEAWIEIDPAYVPALRGLTAGSEVILLTWLHQGRREVMEVHPQNDLARPLAGVFITRSPDRPNPIGLHRVQVLEIDPPTRLRVGPLEAIDGTPVVDIKAVLRSSDDA